MKFTDGLALLSAGFSKNAYTVVHHLGLALGGRQQRTSTSA
jgi:hypothetical protein